MIDLRGLMDERSAEGHDVPAVDRLSAVRRTIALRRMRRTVAGLAVTVAVVAAGSAGYLAVADGKPAQPPFGNRPTSASLQASTSAPGTTGVKPVAGGRIGPFSEYAHGYRVVAIGQAPARTKKVQLTWKVSAADVRFYSYCPGLPGRHLSLVAVYAIDGIPVGSMNCVSELREGPNPFPARPEPAPAGLRVGDTVTVTFTATGAQDNDGRELSSVPAEGTIHFAVAERVRFEDFPLPPRPAHLQLPQPDGMATEPGTTVVFSDPADPNKPVTTTLTWHLGYEFTVIPQTPGIYHVAVNGVDVLMKEVFDYAGNGANVGCSVKPGERTCAAGLLSIPDGATVTVTVVAQYATGPWLAEMRSQMTSSSAHG